MSADRDETALVEARRNAEVNNARLAGEQIAPRQDPVQTTLSKFVGKPGHIQGPPNDGGDGPIRNPGTTSGKATMDVDSFTRLLLTGDRGLVSGKSSTPQGSLPSVPSISETSSSADTSSISRQSLFEPMPSILAETPRTSHELDNEDAEDARRVFGSGETPERRRKPPAPKARHGKPIPQSIPAEEPGKDDQQGSTLVETSQIPEPIQHLSRRSESASITSQPDEQATSGSLVLASTRHSSGEVSKRPPTPPLSRRRSSNKQAIRPDLARTGSTRSTTSTQRRMSASSFSSLSGNGPVPPPPPARRSGNSADLRPSANVAVDSPGQSPADEFHGQARTMPPPPPPSRHSSAPKRSSQVIPAPPPPPPRRVHSSRRDSFGFAQTHPPTQLNDAALGGNESTNQVVSGTSNAGDIMAEIARLQMEVDGAVKAQR